MARVLSSQRLGGIPSFNFDLCGHGAPSLPGEVESVVHRPIFVGSELRLPCLVTEVGFDASEEIEATVVSMRGRAEDIVYCSACRPPGLPGFPRPPILDTDETFVGSALDAERKLMAAAVVSPRSTVSLRDLQTVVLSNDQVEVTEVVAEFLQVKVLGTGNGFVAPADSLQNDAPWLSVLADMTGPKFIVGWPDDDCSFVMNFHPRGHRSVLCNNSGMRNGG